MKTSEMRPYIALLIFTGILAGLVSGCGDARKAEADGAPTAPVVKVARRNLSNTLEIASEFEPLAGDRSLRKGFRLYQKAVCGLGNARQEGATPRRAGNSRVAAAIATR